MAPRIQAAPKDRKQLVEKMLSKVHIMKTFRKTISPKVQKLNFGRTWDHTYKTSIDNSKLMTNSCHDTYLRISYFYICISYHSYLTSSALKSYKFGGRSPRKPKLPDPNAVTSGSKECQFLVPGKRLTQSCPMFRKNLSERSYHAPSIWIYMGYIGCILGNIWGTNCHQVLEGSLPETGSLDVLHDHMIVSHGISLVFP